MSPPHGTPDNSQSVLRRRALDARRSLTEEQREDLSLCIYESTIRDPAFQRVTTIATYLPADDEVNTWPLIERAWRMKKRVFAPVVKKNAGMRFYRLSADTALSTNRFGLPEPESDVEIDPRQLQLVYTPLAAFDDERRRIGMGGGYFDRAFAFMKHRELPDAETYRSRFRLPASRADKRKPLGYTTFSGDYGKRNHSLIRIRRRSRACYLRSVNCLYPAATANRA